MMRWKFVLGGVVALALGLRLLGIDFGLPLHLHPDEWSQVETARNMLGGDLNPHFFRYSSLTIYQLFVTDGALTVAQNVGAMLTTASFFLTGRWLSAVYGAGTVAVVFWLGTLMLNRTAGLIAALILAISAAAVQQAHYATVDTALVFWMLLALGLGVWAFKDEGRSWLPAGVAAGIAIGTKYPGVVILAPLFLLMFWRMTKIPFDARARVGGRGLAVGIGVIGVVIFLGLTIVPPAQLAKLAQAWTTDGDLNIEYVNLINSSWRLGQILGLGLAALGLALFFSERTRRGLFRFARPELVWFSVAVVGTFLISSPFVLFDLPSAARDIFFEYRHMQLGNAADYAVSDPIYVSLLPTSFFPDPLYYWNWFLGGNGWVVVGVSAVGLVGLARKNRAEFFATALLFVLILFSITHGANKADRYGLMLLPILYLWVGVGVVTIASALRTSWQTSGQWALTAIVLILPLLATRTMFVNEFLLPDTRSLAWQWMDTHLPQDATIVREDYTPDVEDVAAHMTVRVRASAFQSLTLTEWQQQHVEYLVIGKNRDWYNAERERYPAIAGEYDDLGKNAQLLASFSAAEGQSVGPPIWIYRVP